MKSKKTTTTTVEVVTNISSCGAAGVSLLNTRADMPSVERKKRDLFALKAPETTRQRVPVASSSSSLRVMTFNLRFDTKIDGANQWRFRSDFACATLRLHGAEVIGFQEALRTQIDDIVTALPEYDWVGQGRDDGKDEGEFSPVFWRKDRFRCLDSGTFWLSETPDVIGSRGWEARCRRIATWARLLPNEDTEKREEVFFLNTHFDHEQVKARDESAWLLRHRIPQLISESNKRLGTPAAQPVVIVVGDLNATEDSGTLRILRGESTEQRLGSDEGSILFREARSKALRKYNEADGTFTNWLPPSAETQKHILIDHVLFHGPVEPEQYGIICELWEGNRRASDHRPVVTDFRFLR